MTDVPFPISRAYNSAPPTGTRLSLGVPVCPPFSLAVEPEGAHAAYAHQAFGNSEKPPRNNGLRGALAVE
jgi:hypothetical protein